MARKLASVQRIGNIDQIPNSDSIETVEVLGWKCVAKKGEFQPGDLCVYFEIDSLLPDEPQFEFLRSSSWKPSLQKYRLRTVRIRGVLSQGLALPISILDPYDIDQEIQEGMDLTKLMRIQKYEEPEIEGSGPVRTNCFDWPISRTDEPRVQSDPKKVEKLMGKPYYITVKLDGTSASYILNRQGDDIVFYACSRNLAVVGEDNPYWQMNVKYGLEAKLREHYEKTGQLLSIQGEICGPKIQKNLLGLRTNDFFVFNIVDTTTNQRFHYDQMKEMADMWTLRIVPLFEHGDTYSYGRDEILRKAERKYRDFFPTAPAAANMEGLVIRSEDQTISFKAINNQYLLKHE